MSLVSQLNKCKSLDSLQTFCEKVINSDDVQFNGRSYIHLPTGEELHLSKVTNRLIDLLETKKSSQDEAQEASFVIFTLKKVTALRSKKNAIKEGFGEGSKLHELSTQFKTTLRKSQDIMSTVVKNYNQLATQVNQKIIDSKPITENSHLQLELQELEFLNQFLGLKWDPNHSKGISPVPLCNPKAIQENSPPESMQPKDCASLGALYGLVKALRESPVVIHEGTSIEIRGKTTITVEDLYHKIGELYEKALKLDPYVKTDLYLQLTATLFALQKLNPMFKKNMPAEIAKISNHAIQELKNDPQSIKQIKSEYNSTAEIINNYFEHKMNYFDGITMDSIKPTSRYDPYDYAFKLECIEFFNQFIEFPLSTEHLQGKVILPIVLDHNNIRDLDLVHKNYNHYGLIINAQIQSRKLQERCIELEKKINPAKLNSLMIAPEERAKLSEELAILKSQLSIIGPPFPARFFELLVKEQVRLATFAKIELTNEQKKGLNALPIIGREVSLAKKEPTSPESRLPVRSRWYNLFAEQINLQRNFRLANFEFTEAWRIHRNLAFDDILENWHNKDSSSSDNVEKLRLNLIDLKSSPNYYGEGNFYLLRLSSLLLIAEPYGLVKLTDKQKNLEEDLPLINVEELPFPGRVVLAKELEQIKDKDKLLEVFNAWPTRWKEEMGFKNAPEFFSLWQAPHTGTAWEYNKTKKEKSEKSNPG